MRAFPLIFLAACTFPFRFADARDEGDEETSDGGDEACDDYLACLAAVEPDTFSALVDTYGGDGTCWAHGATADACIAVCVEEFTLLQEDFPEEVACGGVAPDPLEWPFDDGDWQIRYLEVEESTCGFAEDYLELINATSDLFGLTQEEFPNFSLFSGGGSSDCTLDGSAFTCSLSDAWADYGGEGSTLEHTGTFRARDAASGALTFDDGEGCRGTISFEMTLN